MLPECWSTKRARSRRSSKKVKIYKTLRTIEKESVEMEALISPPHTSQVQDLEKLFFGKRPIDGAYISNELKCYSPSTSLQDGDVMEFNLPPWRSPSYYNLKVHKYICTSWFLSPRYIFWHSCLVTFFDSFWIFQETLLYVELRLTKKDGKALDATCDVSFSNNILHTLFQGQYKGQEIVLFVFKFN